MGLQGAQKNYPRGGGGGGGGGGGERAGEKNLDCTVISQYSSPPHI